MAQPETDNDQALRGCGPVLRADDGTEYQATEDDIRATFPFVAAMIIAMTAWEASSHAEWTLGTDHLYFSRSFRMLIRIVGLGIAIIILLVAWREARAQERALREERARLAEREFVIGKPPRWDE